MNLVTLASHTIDLHRLPEGGVVLDVGCRNFAFTKALLEVRPRMCVIAMDPDPFIVDPYLSRVIVLNEALVGDDRRYSDYAAYSTGEANFLTDKVPEFAARYSVPCTNINDVMRRLAVEQFALVKRDCEGSEFGILEAWPGPIAEQISVEFHDFMDRQRYGADYFARLFAKLADYEVVQHEETPIGPADTMGHWDSLLVRKR
jgi:FkbM family methyltransferase